MIVIWNGRNPTVREREHSPQSRGRIRYYTTVRLSVEVRAGARDRPEVGVPVIVQVRDTSWQDAPARILVETRGEVSTSEGESLGVFAVDLDQPARNQQVWVHVDVDRDGRVSRGDYLTTQSYPVPVTGDRVSVEVKRV